MMTITEALVAEHAAFLTVFEHMESLLPQLGTVQEAQMLAGLAERLLQHHGAMENDLAYAALDHVLADKGRLDRLHQEHKEIDERLEKVRKAHDISEARRLLRAALQASREHFKFEEEHVFPVIERSLRGDALAELGHAWLKQREDLIGLAEASPAQTARRART